MKYYYNLLEDIINTQINKESCSLIKLENFRTPEIYLNISKSYKTNNEYEFTAKLSEEKYNMWNKEKKNKEYLNELKNLNIISFDNSMTKWRNNYSLNKGKKIIILMGTEAVEDKGGLEDFFTITPEVLENKYKYSNLFEKAGFKLSPNEESTINNIYNNIFSISQKDLLKISYFIEEELEFEDSFLIIVDKIFNTLYEYWGIPNIFNILKVSGEKLDEGKIKILSEAGKFLDRSGITKYQTKKALDKLNKKIEIYKEKNKCDLDKIIEESFPLFNNFEEINESIEEYIKGINIEKNKNKLFNCSFKEINEILNIKESVSPKIKKNVMIGDPFKGIFLPILNILNSKKEKREYLEKISIELEDIKIAGIVSNLDKKEDFNKDEELKEAWKKICVFTSGIEKLIKNLNIKNIDDEYIDLKIISEINNEKNEIVNIYPFDFKNTKYLIDNGILSTSSASKKYSEIKIKYRLEYDSEINSINYIWKFPIEYSVFDAFEINTIKEAIGSKKSYIPIGYSKKINKAAFVKNNEDFSDIMRTMEIKYSNIIEESSDKEFILDNRIERFGIDFVEFIKSVEENGLFNTNFNRCENTTKSIELIKKYKEICKYSINEIRNNKNLEFNYLFSKAFLILNNENYFEKNINSSIMIPYHPIMIEKFIDRYNFISYGYFEMFEEIMNSKKSFSNKSINNKFERLNYLSTVTSGATVLLGEENKLEKPRITHNYYSLYGKNKENTIVPMIKNDFSNDEEYSDILSLNPVSEYISKIISDYLNTYPSRIDGINIGFINYKNYKEIISAVHDVITKFKKNNIILKLNVTVFTEEFTSIGENYLKFWLENKFEEENKNSVKLFHKFFDFKDIKNPEDLNSKIKKEDIIFIKDIMTEKEIVAERYTDKDNDIRVGLKRYPSAFLPIPSREKTTRSINISQNQFECEKIYNQLVVSLQNNNIKNDTYKIIKKVKLDDNDKKKLLELHNVSNWVVILDENIDPDIIKSDTNKIIGFSTGKGNFGEINSTISTNIEYLESLKKFLFKVLRKKFTDFKTEEIKVIVNNCIEKASDLDGAEIIKAINPNDLSVNNYLAYMLTAEIEKINEINSAGEYSICKMISLDAYSHIFDNQTILEKEDTKRPDFAIVKIPNNYEETKKIKIDIIECKLAQYNEEHLKKAKIQVTNGYNRLDKIWNTGENNKSVEDRFWLNQLYRIVSYNVNSNEENLISNILDEITRGKIKIDLNCFIYAYWTNESIENDFRESTCEYNDININIKEHGIESIKKLLLGNKVVEFDNNDTNIIYSEADNEIDTNIIELNEEYDKSNIDISNDNLKTEANKGEIEDNSEEKEKNMENKEEKSMDIMNNKKESFIDEDIISVIRKNTENDNSEEEKLTLRYEKELVSNLAIRKIDIKIEDHIIGPDIIRLRITLGTGIDISKVEKYNEDMKLWFKINEKPSIFIENGMVNIDIARRNRQTLRLGSELEKLNSEYEKYADYKKKFYILVGEDVLGNIKIIDMSSSTIPHLLVAGQTGSGKSVLLNSMIISIMSMYTPDEVEFIMVDPKQVELIAFEDSPFVKPGNMVYDSEKASQILDNLVKEMENRYTLFRKSKVKNIINYNKKNPDKKLKRMLMVFDEYGSMIEGDKKMREKLESSIIQLSQKARAAGIHMIICTQSPKAEIITTTIRNNLTGRIALKVTDNVASNLILDDKGAETLLGKGDMLLKTSETSSLERIKSPFIEEDEVDDIIEVLNKKYN